MSASNLISLGIGSPASIHYLITFGLSTRLVLPTPSGRTNYIQYDPRTKVIQYDPRTKVIQWDDRTKVIQAETE